MSEQNQYNARDIITPDSSEARLALLFKKRTICVILCVLFLIVEALSGLHIAFRTEGTHPTKGYRLVSFPTFEEHYVRSKPNDLSLVRPRIPLRLIIWREIKRFW